jgi:hypothetical protein
MNPRPVLLTILLVAASACSGDDDPDTTSVSTNVTTTVDVTTTEPTATTTTPSTTTSTIPPTVASTEPPTTAASTTIATDENWQAIIQTLGQRRQDLYASPEVSRIGEVCGGGTPCFEQLNVQLADLASKGWRIQGSDPYVILNASVEDFDGDTLETSVVVTVIATVQRPANSGAIVDANGATVAQVEAETPVGFNTEGRVTLARVGPEGDPWRLISQDRIREVPA